MEEFSSFDKLLRAWDKDVARFWEFPKIENDAMIDVKKQMIQLGKTGYNLPVLFRLSDALEVSPFLKLSSNFLKQPNCLDICMTLCMMNLLYGLINVHALPTLMKK